MKKLFAGNSKMLPIWVSYKTRVENVMQPPVRPDLADAEYISNRLFTNAIVIGLPVGLIALAATILLNLKSGNIFLPVFGTSLLVIVGFSSLNARIAMARRKLVAAGAMIAMGVILIALRGNYGTGSIYLLTCSIFYALHFSDKFAQRGVWLNVCICLGFIVVAFFNLLPDEILHEIPTARWVTYSVNFLFLNILIVVMIRQTINRLERTLKTEASLHAELKKQNEKLKEIAYLQSHVIRLPLANIMALTDLIEKDHKEKIDGELFMHLTKSCNELDQIIREIVDDSENIIIELNNVADEEKL